MQAEKDFRDELVSLLPRLRRFAVGLTGSQEKADEVVQAACERALSRFYQWRPGSNMNRWMISIMRSIWSNELRAQTVRRGTGFVDAYKYLILDDTRRLEATAELGLIVRAVFALPKAQRVVVLLVYVEGYSYKEAAEILGVPLGTVMSRLARARLSLVDNQTPSVAASVDTRSCCDRRTARP